MTSVLVLNCTYEALGIVDLRRAVRLVFAGKAEVLHADRRSGANLALFGFRLDPRHRDGLDHEERRCDPVIAVVYDARVPENARRCAGLFVRL